MSAAKSVTKRAPIETPEEFAKRNRQSKREIVAGLVFAVVFAIVLTVLTLLSKQHPILGKIAVGLFVLALCGGVAVMAATRPS